MTFPDHAKRFDDRSTDFLSGKKVLPPMEDRKVCACCGLRIAKGSVLTNGDHVGEDCALVIGHASRFFAYGKGETADEFLASFKMWPLRPSVAAYIRRQCPAQSLAA